MKVMLASSLHLDHGGLPPAPEAGQRLPMQSFVPMGLLSLKAAADRELGGAAEIAVEELNSRIAAGDVANDEHFYDRIADILLSGGADVVGLMTDADSLHHTTLIADRIKDRSPATLVCAGGPTTSPMARRFLDRFHSFDFVVRGEGELTFTHLLQTLSAGGDPAAVRGLSWRDGAEAKDNAERALIDDLDDLPIPAFDAYALTGEAALYLDVGRGCPFKCRFCSTAPFWERRFRMKSAARIIDEMRLLRDRWGRSHVNFAHDIFTANQRWTAEFCEALSAARLGMTWSCSTRTDTISPELLRHMADAGCDEIYYGIESGSPAIQARIDKDLDLDRCREIVVATRDAGIRPVTGLIIGYPFETEETFSATLDTFFELLARGGFRAHLFTLCPFPQAPMFHEHRAEIERLADYHDLPLVAEARQEGVDRLASDRELFSSAFRFSTPAIDEALVDAAEEISAHLVLLRRLWPILLPHYSSPLDWYKGWVAWIGAHNRRQRPWSRLKHHGDVRDLLDFISQEVVRLGQRGTLLDSLVRYESIKHAAAETLEPGPTQAGARSRLTSEDSVMRSADVLMAPFRHDLSLILSETEGAETALPQTEPFWILFAKNEEGELNTARVSPLGRRLIDLADRPRPVGELIADALSESSQDGDMAQAECWRAVQALMECNLLSATRTT